MDPHRSNVTASVVRPSAGERPTPTASAVVHTSDSNDHFLGLSTTIVDAIGFVGVILSVVCFFAIFRPKQFEAFGDKVSRFIASRTKPRAQPFQHLVGRLFPIEPPAAGERVLEQDLDDIIKMAYEIHPGHPAFDNLATIFRQWWTLNSNAFRFVVLRNRDGTSSRIGFTCVLPLSEDAYALYSTGVLSEFAIGALPNHIVPAGMPHCRYILIQAIDTLKHYRRPVEPTLAWIRALGLHISKYNACDDKDRLPLLCADANRIGEDLLNDAAFRQLRGSKATVDRRPIYHLDLAERFPTERERSTITLLLRLIGDSASALR